MENTQDTHPIEGLMATAMSSIREMVDVTTIIGEPVESGDGSVLIPVSRVSFGFAAGGGEFSPVHHNEKNSSAVEKTSRYPFAGGSGAGVTIQPVAFMVIGNGGPRMLQINSSTSAERILDMVPGIVQKIGDVISERTVADEEQV
ncbi:MAG TPA: sporulation protein YtfJ [Clostridiales bacterium]|nr:sporulation protein YtfJ [Clostridiales bacterium]